MELRTALVVLVDHFDVSLAPDEDGAALHAELKDCFVAVPGAVRLVFRGRAPEALVVGGGRAEEDDVEGKEEWG